MIPSVGGTGSDHVGVLPGDPRNPSEGSLVTLFGSRGELPESDRTETPRPRESFIDIVAESPCPKDRNHLAPREGNEGKRWRKNVKKIQVQ